MSGHPPHAVTRLLDSIRDGDDQARAELFAMLERDLRKLASAQMRGERPGHILQPTALVNELYLRFGGGTLSAKDRTHFFATAKRAMQNILIDDARGRGAVRRNGGLQVLLDDAMLVTDAPQHSQLSTKQLMSAVERALGDLAKQDARQAKIVDLIYFNELPKPEVAKLFDVSVRTVERDLTVALLFIRRHLGQP